MKFPSNPIDKIYITQKFGANPKFYRKYKLAGHNGVDFRTRFMDSLLGRRQVLAANSGVVSKVVIARNGGYGTYIRLLHADGSTTIYGHQFHVWVKKDQLVKAGQVIGISGNTGDSTGPHLHFGYRPPKPNYANGFSGYIDPLPFLNIPV